MWISVDKPFYNGMLNPFDFRVIENNDKSVVLRALLPGVKEKDIKLSYTSGVLSLAATGQELGEVAYSISLDGNVLNFKNAKASLKDGILLVTIPKVSPEQIEISFK